MASGGEIRREARIEVTRRVDGRGVIWRVGRGWRDMEGSQQGGGVVPLGNCGSVATVR